MLRRIILLLLLAWFILTIQINVDWFGHHDANGVWISAAVRNYQRYGATELRFLPVTSRAHVPFENLTYYTHHPPLIVWLSAISSSLFGFHEMSVRFVPASLTLISIASFFVLARRLLGTKTGLLAAAIYAFVPMMAYFGRMPNHESLALAVTMTFAAVFVKWVRQPNRFRWGLLALCTVLAVWSAWAAMLVIALVSLTLVRKRPADIIALGLVGIAAMAALLMYYEWAAPGSIKDLLDIFVFRSSSAADYGSASHFTAVEFIAVQVKDLVVNLTPGICLLALYGVFLLDRTRIIILALWAMAFLYMLLFRNAFFEHDFYKIYFVPPAAICAAFAIMTLWRRRGFGRPLVIGLMIPGILWAVLYVGSLHRFAIQPYTRELIDAISANTLPDDHIASNLDNIPIGIEYYADRLIERNVTPQQALNSDTTLYLYCSRDGVLPEEMRDLDHVQAASCYFVSLR